MTDIRYTAGLDDTQFVRGITNLETQTRRAAGPVNTAFGSMGASINANTEGLRRMTGAMRGAMGLATGAIGLATGIGAAIAAAVVGIDRLINAERRAMEEFRPIINEIQNSIAASQRARLQPGNQLGADLARAQVERAERLAQLTDLYNRGLFEQFRIQRDLIEQEFQLATAAAEREESIRRVQQRNEQLRGATGAASSFLGLNATEIERLERQTREITDRLLQTRSQFLDDNSALAEIDRLIDAVRREGDARVEQLRRVERERDEAARREEARQRDRQRFEERSLDIELLRLRGLEREAAEQQIRLDIERRMREIELDPARSEADRERLRQKLQEVEALRLAQIEAQTADTQSRTRTLGLGLIGGSSLARQTFGTGDAVTAQQLIAQKSISDSARRTLDVLQGLIEGNALRVEGNFGARLN